MPYLHKDDQIAARWQKRSFNMKKNQDILTEGKYPDRIPLDELLSGLEGYAC